jgi:hypothetical protein
MTPPDVFVWTCTVCACTTIAAGTAALMVAGYHALMKEIKR